MPAGLRGCAIQLGWAVILAAFFLRFGTESWANGETGAQSNSSIAVGAQYDSTHAYVASGDSGAFIKSFRARAIQALRNECFAHAQ
jgi:hypothetical protein